MQLAVEGDRGAGPLVSEEEEAVLEEEAPTNTS